MKSQLGFGSMILLGINGIVGSGIFLLPGQVMHVAGMWSIIVYLFVTLLVLAIAWCFAQCAALFSRNGGAYVYAKEAFGDFIGFEIGLMRWAVGIMAWASLAVGLATALSSIWPQALQEPVRSLFIVSLLIVLGAINTFGVTLFKHLNNLVTVAKLIPLILFVMLGVLYIEPAHYTPLHWEELEMGAFGAASLIIFYAFGGFETLVVAAGEMQNPKKNLPWAVMIVISFCSLLYFLIQLIAIGLLGDHLASSLTPIADAAQILLGDSGKWIVTLTMLISIGGINIYASFITPRSGLALAEDGMIPRWIAERGRFGTPVWAIWLTVGMTGILAIFCDFTQLAIMTVVARFIQYISTCLAVSVLYRRLPVNPTRIKQGLMIIIPAISLVGMGWILWQTTFIQILSGSGVLIAGLPLYWLKRTREKLLADTPLQVIVED